VETFSRNSFVMRVLFNKPTERIAMWNRVLLLVLMIGWSRLEAVLVLRVEVVLVLVVLCTGAGRQIV